MFWTFGIITGGQKEEFINKIINSIEQQKIPENHYQVIIVGQCEISRKNTKIIPFNEKIKPMWITRKKNIISQEARFENIAFLHDYVALCDGWYENFISFGDNWDVCMNPILNYDNTRFRDWLLWPPKLLHYHDHSRTKEMYASGSYYCSKKSFTLKYPLNENLCWNQGEDLDWCFKIRNFWNYRCNAESKVKLLKYKEDVPNIDSLIR